MDLAFAWSGLGLYRGRGQFLTFLNAPLILQLKKCIFSRLMRVYVGFIMLAGQRLKDCENLVISRNDENKQ